MAGATGCAYPALPALGVGQDAGIDTTDATSATTFAPIHVLPQTLVTGAPDLVLSANLTTIDTTALTINGVTSSYFVQQGEYTVLFANAFLVENPVVIHGASPLIVVANGHVIITANIDLPASGAMPGPGATSSGPGAGGAGATFVPPSAPTERESSGGGGGSYGSLGAPGGPPGNIQFPGGSSGLIYGMQPDAPLVGGSSGGNGGFSAAAGGGGGGALQISSRVSISIDAATINAGGGGGAFGGGRGGGGGAGAGGEILLEAPQIMIVGTLAANGGGGGGGGTGGGGIPGTPGRDGTPDANPAPGGAAGTPQGAPGGAGAAGVAGAFVEAHIGGSGASNWGGGGGGAGRIWLRYPAATPPDLSQAVISPPAGLDPTLP